MTTLTTLTTLYETLTNMVGDDLVGINNCLAKLMTLKKRHVTEDESIPTFMQDHYDEILGGAGGGVLSGGKGLTQVEIIEWFYWMSLTDQEKKKILDDDKLYE